MSEVASPDSAGRLMKALLEWRDSLVTFDGRNKQLFYRPLKTGDVHFKDKYIEPAVFERFRRGSMVTVSQLYPSLFGAHKEGNVEGASSLTEEVDEAELDGSRPELHKLWISKLRRFESVYRKAKENFDEKNVETLFLAEGFATWSNLRPGPIPNAPLILHPVKLTPSARGNTDFNLLISGEPFLNQALVLMFEREFGVQPSNFELTATGFSLDSPEITDLLENLSRQVKGFSVSKEFLLGNFSFQKYPMVMDLKRIIDSGRFHPILAALSGDGRSIDDLQSVGTEETIRELSNLNPVLENLIFPADSTQHQAISAVLGGKSVVIQGPPGSGKSQTIANLIAEGIAKNKRILFVAEKRAAIDAVTDRLARKGLAGVVLDLHGDPDRKTIAKDLLAVVKAHSFPPQLSVANLRNLVDAKKSLNERWEWLSADSKIEGPEAHHYSNLELLLELGELRKQIPVAKLKQIEPTLWRLDRFSQEEREEIGRHLVELARLGYFSISFQQLNLLERLPDIFDVENLREFEKALNVFDEFSRSSFRLRSIEELEILFGYPLRTSASLGDAIAILRKYQDSYQTFAMQNFEMILKNKSALLGFGVYRSTESINFISALFSYRRVRAEVLQQVQTEKPLESKELYSRIEFLEEFLVSANRSADAIRALTIVSNDIENIAIYIENIGSAYEFLKQHLRGTDLDLSEDLVQFASQVDQYRFSLAEIRKLPRIRAELWSLNQYLVSPVLDTLMQMEFESYEIEHLWNYAWLTSKLETATSEITTFSLDSTKLDTQISSFAELDEIHLDGNVGKILTNLASRVHDLPDSDRQLLVKESLKKSGHLPFRRLLQQIPMSIMALKPVMAMSPLAVSQILPCQSEMFDLVVFDEASQIRPHDAIASVFRAKQLVVAGDRFQLPPTEFGEKSVDEELADYGENDEVEESATSGMESILTAAVAVFNKNVKPLGLHYRSNDERLISWSNFNIYRKAGEALFTFPSKDVDSNHSLRYTYLPNVKISSMQMPNDAEVEEVKSAVLRHIDTSPELTLGVIAFGSRHALRLQDGFNILEQTNEKFYEWKSGWVEKQDQFFVKNIERVQGDERDSIIISPGYAPNLDGNVPLQFGTLNRQGGERRLNVAASRAKEYVHLITSMKSSQIELTRTKSSSVGLFKSYLDFMENGGRIAEPIVGFETATTPFEAEILEALQGHGLEVDCQVGDSGFKIDFAIRDPRTNAYILAIEADGATYHSSGYARERDYMRQRILESRGWRFVRIWSTDWWRDPDSQINRVLAALDRKPISITLETDELLVESKISKYEDDQEFLIFRGLMAKNRHALESEILSAWMNVLGKQRVTDKLYAKFRDFWNEARRTL